MHNVYSRRWVLLRTALTIDWFLLGFSTRTGTLNHTSLDEIAVSVMMWMMIKLCERQMVELNIVIIHWSSHMCKVMHEWVMKATKLLSCCLKTKLIIQEARNHAYWLEESVLILKLLALVGDIELIDYSWTTLRCKAITLWARTAVLRIVWVWRASSSARFQLLNFWLFVLPAVNIHQALRTWRLTSYSYEWWKCSLIALNSS